MLWLALYLPELPLAVFGQGPASERPLAVSRVSAGRELISRCNGPASAAGVRPGQPVSAARALHGGLTIRPRDTAAEQRLLESLALWAYQFTPRISFDPLTLLLEVGASLRLFGGRQVLCDRIEQGLLALDHDVLLASAPTPAAAALLARVRPGSHAADGAALRELLRAVPLARLTRDSRSRSLLRDVGLHSIGDCQALPRAALLRRTGPALGLILDRLFGVVPDPRTPWQPPAVFDQRLELLAEIGRRSALLFPARRLIQGLCGFLRGRGGATQRLDWALLHRGGEPTRFHQGLLGASRDADHLLQLFRERLERVQLPGPVLAVQLRVSDWQSFAEHSAGLFADAEQPADRALLERLRSRLGESAVQGLAPAADHRPERAWCYCAPGRQVRVPAPTAPRPLWLFDEPRPLTLRDGQPAYGGPLQLSRLPERIESGWWDGCDLSRDYYLAENPAGERLWVFRDRRGGGWFVQGLFD